MTKSDCKHCKYCEFLPHIVIAVAIIISAIFITSGLKEFRTADRYVTVKGLAERKVVSDLGAFSLSFNAKGSNLQNVYADVKKDAELVKKFFIEKGIGENEISFTVSSNDNSNSRYDGRMGNPNERFTVNGNFNIRSKNIAAVGKLTLAAGDLISKGINVGNYYTNYYFTGINAIKPELLSEAIAAARESAKQFANDSESSLGGIRKANQGVITIVDESTNYGNNVTLNKTVRVVSTVIYNLED